MARRSGSVVQLLLQGSRPSLQSTAGSPLACFSTQHHKGAPQLAFEEIICQPASVTEQQSTPNTVVLTHGLLGSARNWRTFARKLGEAAAAKSLQPWRLVLLDLRCHGASTAKHLPPPHNLHTAAADIIKFIKQDTTKHPSPVAIIGHSMGGKVLLEVLHQLNASHKPPSSGDAHQQQPDSTGHPTARAAGFTLPQAWILDSQPGKVDVKADQKTGVYKVLQTVQGLPLPISSRAWLTQHLAERGFDSAMSTWLGSNVVPTKDGSLGWSFDVQGAISMYHSYMELDYWDLLACPPRGTAIHLVQGGASDRWSDAAARLHLNQTLAKHREHVATLAPGSCGSFSAHLIPGAGHWLHVDAPEALLQLLLPKISQPALARWLNFSFP